MVLDNSKKIHVTREEIELQYLSLGNADLLYWGKSSGFWIFDVGYDQLHVSKYKSRLVKQDEDKHG